MTRGTRCRFYNRRALGTGQLPYGETRLEPREMPRSLLANGHFANAAAEGNPG